MEVVRILLVVGSIFLVAGQVFDEAGSNALIEVIDAGSRLKREEEADSYYDIDHGHAGHEDHDIDDRYTQEWVVEITGGLLAAEALADQMGYEIVREVPNFPNLYQLHKIDHPRRGRIRSNLLTRQLADDVRVLFAEQQFAKLRQKRGHEENTPDEDADEADRPLIRVKRRFVTESETDEGISIHQHLRKKREDMRPPPQPYFRFNDELWGHQWYMQDTRTRSSLPRLDLNVLPVYDMGFTGKGVNIVILDDGLETNHTDLRKNYVAEISYDINDNDSDPTPRYGRNLRNSHGTRCAGEIAMEANNFKCGVGVAHRAGIGGIRMLDGTVSDRVEATSLVHALDKVDIYSASWGPQDDGRTVEGPGTLTRKSFLRGITQGRNGKGAIYIWAAGNGGKRGDNCNCDGYVSSIYTLSIGSVSEQGSFPWYGEKCAATMAVTYSSGAYSDQKITTVDLEDKCTTDHTGTSAAAPLAAGIVALALEANPNLTWRDVQHLTVWTSEYSPLQDNYGWHANSAGLRYNLRFGFGLMNAEKFVRTALNWTTVPDKSICSIPVYSQLPLELNSTKGWAGITFQSDGCKGTSNEVNYLEHVEVIVSLEYPVRGRLEIDLLSPKGSWTQVLQPRTKDTSKMGFVKWPFMSVHTWGEEPSGQWQLFVSDVMSGNSAQAQQLTGRITNATLVLHGTSALPAYRRNGPRVYDDEFSQFVPPVVNKKEDEGFVDVQKMREEKPDVSWNDLIGLKLARDIRDQ